MTVLAHWRPHRVLARLGGADEDVLAQCSRPDAERNHHARLGAALVVPFLLATAGVGVIGHVVTGREAVDPTLAVVAVVWGFAIAFLVDPLLLRSTLDLRPQSLEGDGRPRRRRRPTAVTMLLLRFGLSVATAIVIAEPLMTVVFAGAIADSERTSDLATFDEEEAAVRRDQLTTSLEEQDAGLEASLTLLARQEAEAKEAAEAARLRCDEEARGDRGGDPGFGPQATGLCAQADLLEELAQRAVGASKDGVGMANVARAGFDDQRKEVEDGIVADRAALRDRSDTVVLADLGVWERVERMHEEVALWLLLVVGGLFFFADVAPVAYKQLAPPREHDLVAARLRAERWVVDQTSLATEALAMDAAEEERRRAAVDAEHDRIAQEIARELDLRKAEASAQAEEALHALEEEDRVDALQWEIAQRRAARWGVEGGDGPVLHDDPVPDEPTSDMPTAEEPPDDAPAEDEPADDAPAGAPDEDEPAATVGSTPPPRGAPFADLDRVTVGDLVVVLDGDLVDGRLGQLRSGRTVPGPGFPRSKAVMVKAPNPLAPAYGERGPGFLGAAQSLRDEIQTYEDFRSFRGLTQLVAGDPFAQEPLLVLEHHPRQSVDRWLFGPTGPPFDVEAWMVAAWAFDVVEIHLTFWTEGLVNSDAKMDNYLVQGGLDDPYLAFGSFHDGTMFRRRRDAGRLLLCDLGGVCYAGELATEWTEEHMPPEWGGRRGRASFAANVYAGIGLFAHDLLAGGRVLRTRDGRPYPVRAINPRVPEPLARLVEDALHPDPVERMVRLGVPEESMDDGGVVTVRLKHRIAATYRELTAADEEWDIVVPLGTGSSGNAA